MKGSIDIKKYVVPNLPYVMMFWFFSKIAEGYRLSAGADAVTKMMAAVSGLGQRSLKTHCRVSIPATC